MNFQKYSVLIHSTVMFLLVISHAPYGRCSDTFTTFIVWCSIFSRNHVVPCNYEPVGMNTREKLWCQEIRSQEQWNIFVACGNFLFDLYTGKIPVTQKKYFTSLPTRWHKNMIPSWSKCWAPLCARSTSTSGQCHLNSIFGHAGELQCAPS